MCQLTDKIYLFECHQKKLRKSLPTVYAIHGLTFLKSIASDKKKWIEGSISIQQSTNIYERFLLNFWSKSLNSMNASQSFFPLQHSKESHSFICKVIRYNEQCYHVDYRSKREKSALVNF